MSGEKKWKYLDEHSAAVLLSLANNLEIFMSLLMSAWPSLLFAHFFRTHADMSQVIC
jgi:hypothetical protein